jgi:hypothetical protein
LAFLYTLHIGMKSEMIDEDHISPKVEILIS